MTGDKLHDGAAERGLVGRDGTRRTKSNQAQAGLFGYGSLPLRVTSIVYYIYASIHFSVNICVIFLRKHGYVILQYYNLQ